MSRLLVITRSAALFAALFTSTLARAEEFENVRAMIRSQMAQQHVSGLSVAVARDGKIIWEEGFGWADKARRIRATPHTPFSVASVTKPIVATALMAEVAQGRIDLAAPVNRYLGHARLKAWVGNPEDATIRQLASHTAGLPDHYHFFYADQPALPPKMDETIRRYAQLMNLPGAQFQYSNLDYGILGYVLSRRAREPLAELLQQTVFDPVGMADAHFGAESCATCAARYDEKGEPLPLYSVDHAGASAAWASVHDLVLFGMFHAGITAAQVQPILPDALRSEMQQIPAGRGRGYGLGWNVWRNPGGYTVVYHGGNMPGVSADLTLIPDKHLVVAVLANSSSGLPYRVNDEILYGTLLRPPAAANAADHSAATENANSAPPAIPVYVQQPRAHLLAGLWAGAVHTYQGKRTLRLAISDSGEVEVVLGGKVSRLDHAVVEGLMVSGQWRGDLRISDAGSDSLLVGALGLREGKLQGVITAYAPPDARITYGLSQWTELERIGERQGASLRSGSKERR